MGSRARRFVVFGVTVPAVLLLVTGLAGLLQPQRAFAASTSVAAVEGGVLIERDGVSSALGPGGATLHSGDVVRTLADGRAVLTYFDGSVVEVDPGSEVVIEAVRGTPAGDVVILMLQTSGRTWHVVTHLLSPDSRYEVRTPSATAAVRGTVFEVVVDEVVTHVTTAEGIVRTSAAGASVDVHPLQTTEVTPGEPPATPRTVSLPPVAQLLITTVAQGQRASVAASQPAADHAASVSLQSGAAGTIAPMPREGTSSAPASAQAGSGVQERAGGDASFARAEPKTQPAASAVAGDARVDTKQAASGLASSAGSAPPGTQTPEAARAPSASREGGDEFNKVGSSKASREADDDYTVSAASKSIRDDRRVVDATKKAPPSLAGEPPAAATSALTTVESSRDFNATRAKEKGSSDGGDARTVEARKTGPPALTEQPASTSTLAQAEPSGDATSRKAKEAQLPDGRDARTVESRKGAPPREQPASTSTVARAESARDAAVSKAKEVEFVAAAALSVIEAGGKSSESDKPAHSAPRSTRSG